MKAPNTRRASKACRAGWREGQGLVVAHDACGGDARGSSAAPVPPFMPAPMPRPSSRAVARLGARCPSATDLCTHPHGRLMLGQIHKTRSLARHARARHHPPSGVATQSRCSSTQSAPSSPRHFFFSSQLGFVLQLDKRSMVCFNPTVI